MISGACPPPAPSVWKAWMLRPLNAAIVSSTKPDSLSVSLWIATAMSSCSATPRQQSIAAGLDVGFAGLADGGDAAAANADIGLDDARVVDDDRVGDDRIDGALGAGTLALPHAVADHLAAAELHFLAIDRAVCFDLDDEL